MAKICGSVDEVMSAIENRDSDDRQSRAAARNALSWYAETAADCETTIADVVAVVTANETAIRAAVASGDKMHVAIKRFLDAR